MTTTNYSTWNTTTIYPTLGDNTPDILNDGDSNEPYTCRPKSDGTIDIESTTPGHAALVTAGWAV